MEAENTCHSLYQLKQTRGLESPLRLLSSHVSGFDEKKKRCGVVGVYFHVCFEILIEVGKQSCVDLWGTTATGHKI